MRTWAQLRCGLNGNSQSGKVRVDSKLESHLGVPVGPAETSNSGEGAVLGRLKCSGNDGANKLAFLNVLRRALVSSASRSATL